jgi:HPt (histidine-containing phosphotransfer) domain-containing protein
MDQATTNAGAIYSRLGGDPELADIVEMFVEEMPGRTSALLGQLNTSDWEGLRQTVHQLKGAAGSYGFHPISQGAARVESAVRSGEPEERIRTAVEELVDSCSRARSGEASGGSPCARGGDRVEQALGGS